MEPNPLTEEWLTEVLKKKFGDDVEVSDFRVDEGLGMQGDNFCSSTYRISATLSRPGGNGVTSTGSPATACRELQLFAKTAPKLPAHRAFIDKLKLFEREAIVYNKLMPDLTATPGSEPGDPPTSSSADDCTWHPSHLVWPEIYHADEGVVLMEDLSAAGFKLGDKRAGLGRKEAQVVLKTIARFHALSYTLKTTSDLPEDTFKSRYGVIGLDDLYTHSSVKPLGTNKESAARMVKAFAARYLEDDEKRELISRMEAYLEEDFLQRLLRIMLRKSDMDCFTLGDCWINNVMIRYEESEPIEARLLDFQLVRFTHPLNDLSKFCYSSLSTEVFRELDDLLRVYHEAFFDCLEANLNQLSPAHQQRMQSAAVSRGTYPFEALLEDFRRCEEYGFQMSLCCLPILVITKDDFPEDSEGGDLSDDMSTYARIVLEGDSHPAKDKIFDRFLEHALRAMRKGLI